MNRTPFPLFFLAAALLAAMNLVSCRPKYVSDNDFKKAEEAYWNKDYDEAMTLVEEQLKVTPKHLDALFLRAVLYSEKDEYEAALKDVNYALKCYRGEPMVERSRLYVLKGRMLHAEERYSEAVKAFTRAEKLARKDDPGHVQNVLFLLANTYYQMGKSAAVEKVYLRMLDDNPKDAAAMVGLSRNRLDEERYEEALEWLEKAKNINKEYHEVYRGLIRVYDAMGRTDDCIDAALGYYDTYDKAAPYMIRKYLLRHYTYSVARIQKEENAQEEPEQWTVLLLDLYEHHGDYRKAVAVYDRLQEEYGDVEEFYLDRSKCYDELGEYDKAVADLTQAYELSEDMYYISARGDSYRYAGRYDDAIRDYRACLEYDPTEGYYYYALGWVHELSGDKEKAMEYYSQGIDIDQTYAYLYLSRGDLLRKEGKADEAKADFEKVLAIDTLPRDGSCRHYALHSLGKDDAAVEWMDRIIANDPYRAGNYYDKACLYGRMGRLDESLAALDTAFQKGYRSFAHLEHDDDMDPIRDWPEFKALVEEYKFYAEHPKLETGPVSELRTAAQRARTDSLVSEIPMRRKPGGTYEVPCAINGLPLKFIFDTGASDVTLSSVEADFMLKNEYLSERDFRGSRKYLTAAGTICDGAVICLKEVKVGDVALKNVEASVVKNQQAPLLLGQSVLERLGRITIDNENSRIIIRK